ncbi:hypothetical protein BD769DRAFT_174352 [Suillus cothurnatus]|nr:hypothetical protein BD769DRAFT_174352 [Suillus cothurnatus]
MLQDSDPCDLRFLDTLDDVLPIRDKSLQIGTLFGSSRLRLRKGVSKSVSKDIHEVLGAVYIGAHLDTVSRNNEAPMMQDQSGGNSCTLFVD